MGVCVCVCLRLVGIKDGVCKHYPMYIFTSPVTHNHSEPNFHT